MPKHWNKVVTIYNKYEDGDGLLHYYRRVLNNCFWKETNNKVTVSNVTLQSNNHIIRIPQSKDYMSPLEWQGLADKSNAFTLQTGDIVIKGDVSFEINELEDGHRLNDFLAQYKQGIATIVSINDNTDLPNAHYFVKGE